MKYGDKKDDKGSLFIKNLGYLKEDIGLEILMWQLFIFVVKLEKKGLKIYMTWLKTNKLYTKLFWSTLNKSYDQVIYLALNKQQAPHK